MIVIGLTGSIGMGKSTIGAMFETLGVPVHEADHAVARLLSDPKSKARPAIAAAFPLYEYPDLYAKKTYAINREVLGNLVFYDDELMQRLEEILHPLVQLDQNDFIRGAKAKGVSIVCLDIPLLFETGAEQRVDYTVTVSAPEFIQRERVLGRAGFTEEKLNMILKRQMPDKEKCGRSDYVIKTGLGRAHSMKEVKAVLNEIRLQNGIIKPEEEESAEEFI